MNQEIVGSIMSKLVTHGVLPNQYLGSVNYNMDKNSKLVVHKSEERKNRGICLALTSHGMQCDPEVANHGPPYLKLGSTPHPPPP